MSFASPSGSPVAEGDPGRWRAAIDDECVRIACGHLRSIAVSAMVSSTVLVVILRGDVPDAILFTWASIIWFNSIVRLGMWQVFHRRPRHGAELRRWWWALLLMTGFAGSVYGGLVLVTPGEPTLLVVTALSIAVGGHIAGGAQTLVATPGVLTAAAASSTIPLMIAMVSSSDVNVRFLAILIGSYLLTVVAIARRNHAELRASLSLRYENLELAQRLAERSEAEASARTRAELATHDKSRFLAAASHDLRQPLHALTLFTDALRARPLDGQAEHLLARVGTSIDVLHALLDELLDVSRLDAGVVQPAPRVFEASALARQIDTMFTPLARERGLRLTIRHNDLWLHTDHDMVAQILRNLVANAIRYTPRGGVMVAFRARRGRVRVEVWDTGIGIPADQHAAIFTEFHQLANPERDRSKGVGLGLSIVERLARLLDTKVAVASRLGRGSVFSFEVPTGTRGAVAPERAHPGVLSPSKRGELVLVIDDDALAREGLAAVLEAWGYRALVARDVSHGTELAGSHPEIGAVIVDFRLPEGRTGADALDAVSARLGRMPRAVIVTGETEPTRIRAAQSTGCPVLLKPIKPARLRDTLAGLLASNT